MLNSCLYFENINKDMGYNKNTKIVEHFNHSHNQVGFKFLTNFY